MEHRHDFSQIRTIGYRNIPMKLLSYSYGTLSVAWQSSTLPHITIKHAP